MAVKKYTNRPELAESDPSWTLVGDVGSGGTYDPRNYVEQDTGGYYDSYDLYNEYPESIYGYAAPQQSYATGRSVGSSDYASMGIGQVGDDGNYTPMAGIGMSAAGPQKTQYKPAVGRITTKRTTYGEPFPEAPTLKGIDKRRVRALTQKALAPRLRLLRSALQRALVRSYENPNVRRMIVREALQGYGQGLETARAGAEAFAMQEETQERAIENQNMMMAYQNALEKHRLSATTTETSRDIFSPEEARSISKSGEEGKSTSPLGYSSRRYSGGVL